MRLEGSGFWGNRVGGRRVRQPKAIRVPRFGFTIKGLGFGDWGLGWRWRWRWGLAVDIRG